MFNRNGRCERIKGENRRKSPAIEVTYGISLTLNGQKQTLTDVNGKEVFPFVYAGTTYVPIRAVSENLGGIVNYDQSTNTASIYFNAAAAAEQKNQRTQTAYGFLGGQKGCMPEFHGPSSSVHFP